MAEQRKRKSHGGDVSQQGDPKRFKPAPGWNLPECCATGHRPHDYSTVVAVGCGRGHLICQGCVTRKFQESVGVFSSATGAGGATEAMRVGSITCDECALLDNVETKIAADLKNLVPLSADVRTRPNHRCHHPDTLCVSQLQRHLEKERKRHLDKLSKLEAAADIHAKDFLAPKEVKKTTQACGGAGCSFECETVYEMYEHILGTNRDGVYVCPGWSITCPTCTQVVTLAVAHHCLLPAIQAEIEQLRTNLLQGVQEKKGKDPSWLHGLRASLQVINKRLQTPAGLQAFPGSIYFEAVLPMSVTPPLPFSFYHQETDNEMTSPPATPGSGETTDEDEELSREAPQVGATKEAFGAIVRHTSVRSPLAPSQ